MTEYHLEDVLQMTGHVVEEGSQYAKKTRSAERGGGGAGLGFSEMVGRNHSRACGGAAERALRRDAVKEEAARVVAEGREGGAADGYPEHVALSLSVMDEEKVTIDAIHALVAHIDATRGPGAVLVVMPTPPHISPDLPTSPHISLHLPASPCTSPHLAGARLHAGHVRDLGAARIALLRACAAGVAAAAQP